MGVSNTYKAVAVTLIGYLLRAYGHDLPDEQVADFVSVAMVLGGVFWTLYERWKKGGVHWHGVKK